MRDPVLLIVHWFGRFSLRYSRTLGVVLREKTPMTPRIFRCQRRISGLSGTVRVPPLTDWHCHWGTTSERTLVVRGPEKSVPSVICGEKKPNSVKLKPRRVTVLRVSFFL